MRRNRVRAWSSRLSSTEALPGAPVIKAFITDLPEPSAYTKCVSAASVCRFATEGAKHLPTLQSHRRHHERLVSKEGPREAPLPGRSVSMDVEQRHFARSAI